MIGVAACAVLSAAVGAGASQVHGVLRKSDSSADRSGGFMKALEFKHRLRVCNAYPYSGALDVYRGKSEITDKAMPYKKCEDFLAPMKAGDKLEFKIGDASAGTFAVADLPNNDAVLLLVIHRHDTV